MKFKWIITSFISIVLSTSYLFVHFNNEQKNQVIHNQLIQEVFINKGNYINDNYLGYIEIKKVGIKRLIKEGTTMEILNQKYVGHIKNSSNLDSKFGNTILAGHNISLVFNKLRLLNIGDRIDITTYQKNYEYKIINKEEISTTNKKMFIQQKNKKILTLITCTNSPTKRLIIVAQKV